MGRNFQLRGICLAVTIVQLLSEENRAWAGGLINVPGVLQARERVTIKARALGTVKEITVREGDLVQKGKTLLLLDSTQERLELKAAELQLKEAERKLAERNGIKDLLARSELAQLGFDVEKYRNEVEIRRHRASLGITKSPFGGHVVGIFVTSGDTVEPGGALIEIVNLSKLRVDLRVPSESISSIKVGKKLKFKTEQGSDGSGTVEFVSPLEDVEAGGVRVILAVDNHVQSGGSWTFRPGTTVSVLIP